MSVVELGCIMHPKSQTDSSVATGQNDFALMENLGL